MSVKRTHKGPLRDTLAKNMRRLRATRKLTQEALAYDCGINRTYLSAVERSERNVSIDTLRGSQRGYRSNPGSCSRMTNRKTHAGHPRSRQAVANWLPGLVFHTSQQRKNPANLMG